MPESHSRSILAHRTVTVISLIVSIFFTLRYMGGHWGHHAPGFFVHETPFTANGFVILVYWVYLFINQIFFLSQYYSSDSSILESASGITWHFTVFNLLHALWIYTFSHKHFYIWSEVVLVVNLFNLLYLYVDHKPYGVKPLSKWLAIHPPTAALPLSWVMYAIFWNGSVAFQAHKGFVARIFANIFIWEFLVVPAVFLVLYNDWAIGLSTAVLVFGIGLSQFFTKLIALQWIFAFVISGLLVVLSILFAFPALTPPQLRKLHEDNRTFTSERAPLLDPSNP